MPCSSFGLRIATGISAQLPDVVLRSVDVSGHYGELTEGLLSFCLSLLLWMLCLTALYVANIVEMHMAVAGAHTTRAVSICSRGARLAFN